MEDLVTWMHKASSVAAWRTNAGQGAYRTYRFGSLATPDVFKRWHLSILEKFSIRIGIKACRNYASRQKAKQVSWDWIPGITKCIGTGLKNGPVSFVWSVRLASITPQQLATIGKKCFKALLPVDWAAIPDHLE